MLELHCYFQLREADTKLTSLTRLVASTLLIHYTHIQLAVLQEHIIHFSEPHIMMSNLRHKKNKIFYFYCRHYKSIFTVSMSKSSDPFARRGPSEDPQNSLRGSANFN